MSESRLIDNLVTLADCAARAGCPDLEAKLTRLAQRTRGRQFQVAVLGRFSAGKSQFLNALLQRPDLLPHFLRESTAVLTRIAAGPDRAELLLDSGRISREVPLHEVRSVVIGAGVEQLAEIRIQVDGTLLPAGAVLLDTPGINSLSEERGAITAAALQEADLVIYVVNQTLSESDIQFLQGVLPLMPRVLFIANQMDRLRPGQETPEQMRGLMAADLQRRLGLQKPDVFAVSALAGTGLDQVRLFLEPLIAARESLAAESARLKLQAIQAELAARIGRNLAVVSLAESTALGEREANLGKLLRSVAQVEAETGRLAARCAVHASAWEQDVLRHWEDRSSGLRLQIQHQAEAVASADEARGRADAWLEACGAHLSGISRYVAETGERFVQQTYKDAAAAAGPVLQELGELLGAASAPVLTAPVLADVSGHWDDRIADLRAELEAARTLEQELAAAREGQSVQVNALVPALDELRQQALALAEERAAQGEYAPVMVEQVTPGGGDALGRQLSVLGNIIDIALLFVPLPTTLAKTGVEAAKVAAAAKGIKSLAVTERAVKQVAFAEKVVQLMKKGGELAVKGGQGAYTTAQRLKAVQEKLKNNPDFIDNPVIANSPLNVLDFLTAEGLLRRVGNGLGNWIKPPVTQLVELNPEERLDWEEQERLLRAREAAHLKEKMERELVLARLSSEQERTALRARLAEQSRQEFERQVSASHQRALREAEARRWTAFRRELAAAALAEVARFREEVAQAVPQAVGRLSAQVQAYMQHDMGMQVADLRRQAEELRSGRVEPEAERERLAELLQIAEGGAA